MRYTITQIEVQKKNPDRSSIFINEQFAFGMTTKAVGRYGLCKGQVFDELAYEDLLASLQLDKAKVCALNSLSRGNKTEKQMKALLEKHEYAEPIIEKVMVFLKKYQYIDDEAFTKRYIECKGRSGHKSLRQLKMGLYQKGIQKIDVPLNEEAIEKMEIENILYFLKKYKFDSKLDKNAQYKIVQRLMSRGFKYENIEKSIRIFSKNAEQ